MTNLLFKIILGFMLFIGFGPVAFALQYPLPPKGVDIFGKLQFVKVKKGDTFEKIGQRYDVGFYEMVEANPNVNPEKPGVGTELIVPTQYIIPRVARKGIVINLAAMRLYYFPEGKNYFYTYPVGIGKEDWNTPLGPSRITEKIKNPVWVVPDSIYAYRKKIGDPVPHVVEAGPDNPLGDYAMRLSQPTYLIHGTNEPGSVGRRSSAGCIHLYPADIKALFGMTALRTSVLIINQPYVVGMDQQKVYIEAHEPLQEQRAALARVADVAAQLIEAVVPKSKAQIDWGKAKTIIQEHTGLPTRLGSVLSQQT